jgi:hypothetical protein
MNSDEEVLLTGDFREKRSWATKLTITFISKRVKLDHTVIHFAFLYITIGVLAVWASISTHNSRDNGENCRDPSIGFYCEFRGQLDSMRSAY